MRTKWMMGFSLMLLVAALWGCGSNGGSGGSDVPSGATTPTVVGSSSCKVCHTDVAVTQGFNGSVHDDDTDAGCEGCHGGGQFHRGLGPIPYPSPSLVQCDVCHDVTVRHINGDDPATSVLTNNSAIEGYTKVDNCLGCHAGDTPAATTWQHDPENLVINRQWANSAHGGHIAAGPVTSATGDAWLHYNWDNSTGNPSSSADPDRKSCQRCHTATGISNFLTSPATYSAANNDFSHLSGWTATNKTSPQNELLYCWGCHSDVATGTLRNPGAITETYATTANATNGTSAASVTVPYDDIAQSNVCMGCHLGREVGAIITNTNDDNGILSFINSHYLTAGATIFNESGYEYANNATNPNAGPYDNFGFHKEVGVGNAAGTGTAGPCVTCHMTSTVPGSHSFSVVTTDAAGTITAVATTQCANCHAAMTPAVLEGEKETFHAAMEELRLALAAKGIYFQARSPYFFVGPGPTDASFTNWQSVATAIGTANPTAAPVDWRKVMGAAFNYNLLEHDPGAYAHNRSYALKLVADSIDFLNDGLVDGDRNAARAGIDIGVLDTSGSPFHANAVAAATADPTYCASCHRPAAHFGGNTTSTGSTPAQWVAPYNNVYPACSTCHAGSVIGANTAILDQYATSNHGDVLSAWNHVTTAAPTVTTITAVDYRTWCHRCHTTQGFIDQAAYTVSNLPAAFPLWPSVAGQTMLDAVACDACHTDVATAATRNVVGPYTASYYSAATAFGTAANIVYSDVGPSSMCVRCHSGRDSSGIGQNIKDSAVPAAAATVLRTHYLGSALTLFNTGGYHFGAIDYSGLGTHKTNGTGEGPCVNCHMSGTAGHTFWPIAEDETTGAITAVLSGACTDCHGADMTAAYLTEVRNDFKTVKNALEAALQAKGIFYRNEQETVGSTGRFYTSSAHTTELTFSSTTPSYTSLAAAYLPTVVAPKDLMGAAFNLAFVDYIQEPGAYVHNWEYARKLLIDSIDLIADGVIDGNGIPAEVVAINAKYPSL